MDYALVAVGIAGMVLSAGIALFGAWWEMRRQLRRQRNRMYAELRWLARLTREFQGPLFLPSSGELSLREMRALRDMWMHQLRSGEGREAGAKKKDALQKMGPKTFYVLDVSQVKDLYSQVFQELQPTQIETEEIEETEKGISADFKVLAPKYERGKAVQTRKTYDVDLIPAVMYNEVEAHLIDKGLVSFGIEDFEYDESSVREFASMCTQMKAKFNFDVPEDLQEKFVVAKKHELALNRARELSDTSGYVAIQAEFTVSSVADGVCLLALTHPLNAYLSEDDAPVSIKISCDEGSLSPSGLTIFTEGNSVKITCFGKVVSWDDPGACLIITPIAIY